MQPGAQEHEQVSDIDVAVLIEISGTGRMIEQRGGDGRFGRPRLIESISNAKSDGVIDRVMQKFDTFHGRRPLSDDVTLMHISRRD